MALDNNAKAYAIERLDNTLFDLNRQRNFIDGMRVFYPFMGPMVEAFENWARVIKKRPVEIWRRGLQAKQMLWDTPLEQAMSSENNDIRGALGIDPKDPKFGMFFSDPETGDEMIRIPFTGMINSWLHETASGAFPSLSGVSPQPIDMRLRGLNTVMGTQDLTQGVDNEFSGIPISAFNPGEGFVFKAAVAPLLRSRDGLAGEIYDEMFPFGEGGNLVEDLLPFHLRTFFEGSLGEESQYSLVVSTNKQFEQMWATGAIGDGPDAVYDPASKSDIGTALEVARGRAIRANWVEGFWRGLLPSATSPELIVEVEEMRRNGVRTDGIVTMAALGDEIRTLMSEEGAEWLATADGYKVSTEGDEEVTTDYLNKKYNMNIYSTEFMQLPVTTTIYSRVYTDDGLIWTKGKEPLLGELPVSGQLLMADYANALPESQGGTAEFSFEARQAAMDRGDLSKILTMTDHQIAVEEKLLAREFRGIEIEAARRFGPDDVLEGDAQDYKDSWERDAKEIASAKWHKGNDPASHTAGVRNEILGWRDTDWSKVGDLSDEEKSTVVWVSWYLALRDEANARASQRNPDYRLHHKGSGADDQEYLQALREDVAAGVEAQVAQAQEGGMYMGNFVYIYERYLSSEWDKTEDFDQLEALEAVRRGDWSLIGAEG